MTQDEIIDMAVSNGFYKNNKGTITSPFIEDVDISKLLLGFAKDVATKEREACAEIAEKQRYAMNISLTSYPAQNGTAVGILNQIRARGEA